MRISNPSRAAALTLALAWSSGTLADDYDRAIALCQDKIRDVYRVSDFRGVTADQEGNYKFMVYGKVKHEGQKYPFDCKVKNNLVKSYHYDGPHGHGDKDDSNLGAALAVGAGLAIIAAVAASQDDDKHDDKHGAGIDTRLAEDNCHDELVYRMREELNRHASVRLRTATLHGQDLTGEGKVTFDSGRPSTFSYTCHLDRSGHVRDSSYYMY